MPCEVVGLGGLLTRPEVVDVVSTLRVLADPAAGGALVRLLTGPRWRLGPRDLDALGRRARHIAVSRGLRAPAGDPRGGGDRVPATTAAAPLVDPDYDAVDERSLVDALDDPGPSSAYSAEGHRRVLALRDQLRRLRRWTSSSLPDLVMAVVRALDLDVELASRPGVRPADALLDVDRLVEVAEEFVASGEDPGLVAFLAYLDTAEERERGLEVEVAEPDAERVQLMTVHAAKGLEWDAVFVAGLTKDVFPVGGRPVADWGRQVYTLPFPLRGDRDELPVLDWQGATDQVAAHEKLARFTEACKARGALEERRLAYVAVTRARTLLACSGSWWDTTVKKPRGPSSLLDELHDLCRDGGGTVAVWTPVPDDGAPNPMAAEPPSGTWPSDPLGCSAASTSRPQQRWCGPRSTRSTRSPVPDPATARPVPTRTRGCRAGTTSSGCSWPSSRAPGRATPARSSSCPPGCRCPSSWPCGATRCSWPGHCAARSRVAPRRRPAGAPASTSGSSSGGDSSGSSTSTSFPVPLTTPPPPTPTCRRCRRRSGPATGGPGCRRRWSSPSTWSSTGCCCAAGATPSSPTTPRASWTSSTGRPAALRPATRPRPQPCSWPSTGWPGTTSPVFPLDRIRAAFHYVGHEPHRAPGRPARPGRRRGPGPVGPGGVSRAAARRGVGRTGEPP